MSVVTVVGGGLILLSLAYLFVGALVPFLHTPRPAKFVLGLLSGGSAASAAGCGFAVILGGEGPLGFTTGQWAASFVVIQLVGVWSFNAILGVYVVTRRW